jgi:GTP diphosphokinase / guanosine-3',5'-bis(diphosphate) 3'-diphosphatase
MDDTESLFTELLQELETYLPPEKIRIIYEAYQLAADAHQGQQRQSGEPYISHPLAVA